MDELEKFSEMTSNALEKLFQAAKAQDEFAYIFALLGINSGMEDAGWQPIAETHCLMRDVIGLVNAPLEDKTKIRLLLMLYCQLTEANYPYHILYNMLLAVEAQNPPRVFNFLEKYKNGAPPSVKSKIQDICQKATALGHDEVKLILDTVFNAPLRNAVSHADFIIFGNKLRLKHKMREIQEISFDEITIIVDNAINFFNLLSYKLHQHKTSYQDGHIIKNRKNKSGIGLADIVLSVDSQYGVGGFKTSSPLPLW